MGAAGPAIIVVCALAMLGILSFFLACYFAHCFLTVVIDSAAGVNEVRWPSESFTDWLTKPLYLLWVLLPLLFLPSVVLVITGNPITFLGTLLLLLWLVSPIMFLSSLAAKSWMSLFYGPFLKRWARFFHAYAIFLLWSGPLTAIGAALLVWATLRQEGVLMAAIFLPVMFLLYFRVLGRYAWYVTTRRMKKAKRKPINPAKALKVESLDPWLAPETDRTEVVGGQGALEEDDTSLDSTELPQISDKIKAAERVRPAAIRAAAPENPPLEPGEEEDEWTKVKKPYLVMTETQAKASYVERKGDESSDADGYAIEHISLEAPVSLWQFYVEREKKEEELRAQGKAVRQYERPRKPPTLGQAMTGEIVSFLFFSHTLRCWMNLALLFGAELAILNLIMALTRMSITGG